jgi:hypothetical protein
MIKRALGIVVVALALVTSLGTTKAEAKKVPIPCTGDRFVAVQAPAFNSVAKAKNLQLAYRFSGCSGAGFVAYDGGNRYMVVPANILAEIEKAQGQPLAVPGVLKGLFAAPGHFWVEWIYLVLIGCIAVGVLMRGKTAARAPDADHVDAAATPAQATAAPAITQRAPRMPSPTAGAKPAFGKLGTPARSRTARMEFATRKTA